MAMQFKFNTQNFKENYISLDYDERHFTNEKLVSEWEQSGMVRESLTMGVNQIEQPYDWMQDFLQQLSIVNLNNIEYCFGRLLPGHFLPLHSDTYNFYKKKYGITDTNSVVRMIVFLNYGVPGQLLVVDNKTFSNWKPGDAVLWQGATPHLAANLSKLNRYTLQITGTLDD